jgi:hypothetical protein
VQLCHFSLRSKSYRKRLSTNQLRGIIATYKILRGGAQATVSTDAAINNLQNVLDESPKKLWWSDISLDQSCQRRWLGLLRVKHRNQSSGLESCRFERRQRNLRRTIGAAYARKRTSLRRVRSIAMPVRGERYLRIKTTPRAIAGSRSQGAIHRL